MGTPKEREVALGQVLEVLVEALPRSIDGLRSFVTEHAEEVGLKSLGVLDEWPGREKAPPLEFGGPQIDWDNAIEQLLAIGKPTGLYLVPEAGLLGIRGEDGEIVVRLSDVTKRRLHGLRNCLLGVGP